MIKRYLNRIRSNSTETNLCWGLFVLYLIVTFVFAVGHVPWRDETQVWLIARDLSPAGIFRQMRYEGHPALLHYLVMPLAKLNLPVVSMCILNWCFTSGTAYLILIRSPLKLTLRFFILISGMMLSAPILLARNYAVFVFLGALFLTLYPKREAHPLLLSGVVALLANTHLIGAFLAVGFALVRGVEFLTDLSRYARRHVLKTKRETLLKQLAGLFIMLAGFLLLVLQVGESLSSNQMIDDSGEPLFSAVLRLLEKFSANLFGTATSTVALVLALAFFFFMVISLLRSYKALLFFLSTNALLLYMYSRVYQKPFDFFLVYFVFAYWLYLIHAEEGLPAGSPPALWRTTDLLMPLMLCLLLATGFKNGVYDIDSRLQPQAPASASKEVGLYLNQPAFHDAVFVGSQPAYDSPITAYLDDKKGVWHAADQKFSTFTTWDEAYMSNIGMSIDSIVDAAYAYFPEDQKIIFIFPNFHKENADQNTRIRLIYSSQIAVNDESYVLYEAVRE